MKSKHWLQLVCLWLSISVLLSPVPLIAGDNPHNKHVDAPAKTSVRWAKQVQQGFDLKIWLSNMLVMGKMAFDNGNPAPTCGSTGIGCEYPAGSCIEHIYGMGPWIGGLINGTRYVTEGYNGDAGHGFLLPVEGDSLRNRIWHTSINDTAYNPDAVGYYKRPMNRRGFDDDGDGKIDEDELDGIDNDHDWVRATDDIGADGIPDTLEVGCKGIYDPITNPDPAFDNYSPASYDSCHRLPNDSLRLMSDKDRYTEGNGIPDHGEPHVDEDYGALSESDYYLSATDTFHFPMYQTHRSMGIKVFQKSYAWSEYGTILPMDYFFINVGKSTIKDVYVVIYVDADVGPVSKSTYYQNNYSAYIDSLRTAYTHNPLDRESTPIGLTVLELPKSKTPIKQIWQWFMPGTSLHPPMDDSTLYGRISGEQGLSTPDQPMTNLSDTRFFFSFGPFDSLEPGDTLKLRAALVSGTTVEYTPGNLIDNIKTVLALKQGLLAGVPQAAKAIPTAYRLYQSYPNPFNPSARIAFDVPVASYVILLVYNVLGQEVARLYDGEMVPGSHEVAFSGQNLSSGVYYYQLRASGSGASGKSYQATGKMMLVK